MPSLISCGGNNCELELRAQSSTLLHFTQTYTKTGVPIHKDPNKITTEYFCHTCKNKIIVTTKDGRTEQRRIYNAE